MTDIKEPRYYQVNATLDITLPRDDSRGTAGAVRWLDSCLNAQPDAEVTITNATGFLSGADFLDPMNLHEDHPDYGAEVRLINKVETWLTLDRKALISELIRQHNTCESAKLQQALQASMAQAS